MAIVGRTPASCFGQFREHLQPLFGSTLGPHAHLCVVKYQPDADGNVPGQLMVSGQGTIKVITRKFGTLFLHVNQDLRAQPREDGSYELRTLAYSYKLSGSAKLGCNAFLRWESVSREAMNKSDKRYPRRHVQIVGVVPFKCADDQDHQLDLNELHTPTGWMLMEHVIRFLITECGYDPPSNNWHKELDDSEQKYRREFDRGAPARTS